MCRICWIEGRQGWRRGWGGTVSADAPGALSEPEPMLIEVQQTVTSPVVEGARK